MFLSFSLNFSPLSAMRVSACAGFQAGAEGPRMRGLAGVDQLGLDHDGRQWPYLCCSDELTVTESIKWPGRPGYGFLGNSHNTFSSPVHIFLLSLSHLPEVIRPIL